MATETTATTEREETERPAQPREERRGTRIGSRALEQVRNGRAPLLLGGALLVRAALALRSNRRRALAWATVGGALVGVGLHQRRGRADESAGERAGTRGPQDSDASTGGGSGVDTVGRRAESNEDDANPRGVEDEPDVETVTPADEGSVQFTTEQDEGAERKPHLDEDDPKDPRYPDEDDPEPDDHVTVDLSSAAMADEASEAVGPDPEQAYPSIEGTDPEPTGEGAPERSDEGAVDQPDVDAEESESREDERNADSASDTESDANEESEADDESTAEADDRDDEST